jgi:carboxymethylenebutenolidase
MHLTTPEGPVPDLAPTRRTLGLATLAGSYAAFVSPVNAAAITTPGDGLVQEMVSYPSAGFALPAFVARPAGLGRRGVVIVVSEVFGLHEYIRDVCRRLARQGHVAIAPSFFARAGDPSILTEWDQIRAIVNTATNAQVMDHLDATLAWLDRQAFVDRARIAVTGFCWGGAVTWMAMAHTARFKAGVAWYGRLVSRADQAGEARKWPIEVAGDLKAPVLGLYAEKDNGIPLDTVETMRAALRAANRTDSEIVVYPRAQHGFHADYRPAYDASAAHDGWTRLTSWFAAAGLDGSVRRR